LHSVEMYQKTVTHVPRVASTRAKPMESMAALDARVLKAVTDPYASNSVRDRLRRPVQSMSNVGSTYRPPTAESHGAALPPVERSCLTTRPEPSKLPPTEHKFSGYSGKILVRDMPYKPPLGDSISRAELEAQSAAAFYRAKGKPISDGPYMSKVGMPFVESPMVAVFKQLDSNNSGGITVQEFIWAMQKIGVSKRLTDAQLGAFHKASKDGDTVVQLMEWEAGLLPEVRRVIESKQDTEGKIADFESMLDLTQVFRNFMRHFDVDRNGKLTISELQKALLSIHMGSSDVQDILGSFTNDRDGFVSKEEFATHLTVDQLDNIRRLMIDHGLEQHVEAVTTKDKVRHLKDNFAW